MYVASLAKDWKPVDYHQGIADMVLPHRGICSIPVTGDTYTDTLRRIWRHKTPQ